jgi:hypothetical protein
MDDEIFVERCCSRCDRISSDSMVGHYMKVCPKKGRWGKILRCDTNGRRMETDNEGYCRIFAADGEEVTTVDRNAEDQRLGSDD